MAGFLEGNILKPYELLKSVLLEIEKGIRDNVNADILAETFFLSSVHLQRLFKFAFNQTIGCYIRSRRLAVSLDDLLKTNSNVLQIAIKYGFEYEETYIRAFKREFGMTPGSLRKTGEIVKVTPPIHLFETKKADDSVFFGPEIVMVPTFHVIGKRRQVPGCDLANLSPKLAVEFWNNERKQIKMAINLGKVYIGLARNFNFGEGIADYMPSVPVKNLKTIPQGFSGDTFESSLCTRFRYIGQHHYFDLNRERMEPMYKEIWKFYNNEQEKYALLNDTVYFEKVDSRQYDGIYCQMEVFIPVVEKNQK
jgi:AraC family transcriptional regulator